MSPDEAAFAMRQASIQASLLVATAGFGADDWSDLKHDITLDLLRRAPKFDPSRGDWRGFVRGVAHNHATVLVMRKRRRVHEVNFEDLAAPDATGTGGSFRFLDRHLSEGVDALHHRLEVQRIVGGLPSRLQLLAHLLTHMSIKEVCIYTGRSRSRVYQMTRKIREAFVRAGLGPPNQPCSSSRTVNREHGK